MGLENRRFKLGARDRIELLRRWRLDLPIDLRDARDEMFRMALVNQVRESIEEAFTTGEDWSAKNAMSNRNSDRRGRSGFAPVCGRSTPRKVSLRIRRTPFGH